MRLGEHLAKERPKGRGRDPKTGKWPVPLREIARCLGVDERTLRNWRRNAAQCRAPKIGRPGHGPEIRRRAFFAVGRELVHQKFPGGRKIAAALGTEVPKRLVQEYVSRFKALRRRRNERRKKRTSVRTQVLAKNAVWSQDAAHLGRTPGGRVEGEILKDRGAILTIATRVGPAATGAEVVELLDAVKPVRGLPLVFSTDNGPQYRSGDVDAYLEREQVVHLYSLPRTPQHNGSAEIQIRNLKETAELGKGVLLDSAEEAAVKLAEAAACIDETRPLVSRGLKTARELDDTMPVIDPRIRAKFFTLCRTRMKKAVASTPDIRAGRLAEREAVFFTLEEFGLVKRTQGGRPYVTPKAEVFS